MTKKIISILLVLVMAIFVFAGCGGSSQTKNKDNTNAKQEETLSGGKVSSDGGNVIVDTQPATVASAIDDKIAFLNKGDSDKIDGVGEFTLDYFEITSDVKPPAPGSYYSHYEASDGKVYVDICFAYKNLETNDVDADEILNGTLIYGERYEYSGFSMIEEDNRGDFTYSNITSVSPLTTEYVHYLFEVPEEIKDSDYSVIAEMSVKGKSYNITVKDGTSATAVNHKADKTSGEITVSEKVSNGKSEFMVEFTNITNDVKPPRPDSFYSHYEADSGKTFVELCIEYKSLANRELGADDVIDATMIYAGSYEYSGFSTIEEDNRGDFTYTNITNVDPLATEYIHYLFEVPAEVETSTNSIIVELTVSGCDYTLKVR